ncbi:MAG: tetratricopeptide repeat-containing sensor histidine kinase [Bacteroidales bacterium]|nr:tetratricopeptide repeat-containing sensor histidine kinase [Bacteroidales bacterium]
MRNIVFLFLLIPLTLNAGELSYRWKHTDTLKVEGDSARLSYLLTLCWEHRNAAPELSVKYGTQAIDLAVLTNDYNSLSKAYGFVGVAYRIMGKYSRAVDYYYKGLEVSVKYGLTEQAGYSYLNLANLYVYQELSALATENLKKAGKIAGELALKPMLAYVNMYQGRIFSLDGKLDSALISYRQSLSLRQELNQLAEQATCYKYIGDIYFMQGDLKAANDNYNLSLEKVDKENDKDLYANLLIKKSLIFLNHNDIRQASSLAGEAYKTACEIGANMTIKDALNVLVKLSLLNKDYKTASELQQKVIQYNDTLFSKQLSEKIFLLEYQLEKQQRNAKIDLLNKDNTIKDLRIRRIRIISIALTTLVLLLAAVFIVLLSLLKQRRKHEELLELQNREITKQSEAIELQNRKLTESNEKLEISEAELKRIVQTKDKLFSIIAHDLRNPFTALIGLTELLHENAGNIDSKEMYVYVTMINESSHKLLQLIENLLQWARSQTGTLKLVKSELVLWNLTEDVLKIYSTQAEAKGISLKNEIPGDIKVYADQEILATVIRNLISNGIKYTRKGGSVNCSASADNGKVVLKISDTGVGMSSQMLEKLFSIENTFTTEGTGNEVGTGLGLVICKEFIETLGGTISIESMPGTGTTVFVTLPAS